MAAENERSAAPRVTLLVRDRTLREKLLRGLRDSDVELDEGAMGGEGRDEADLVVLVDERRARKIVEGFLGREDAPSVVVLSDGATASEQAGLAAGGVRAVLSPEASTREIGSDVIDLARAAAGGTREPTLPRFADFVTRSPRMRELVDLARRVSRTESTILIGGETGVGKERLARAVHAESPRSIGPFVSVNAGAIPENLLESELFGHVRGAFTGATESRRGQFAVAQGGTLFLDEIGEMPLHLQVKLLNVLQDRAFRPVGSEAMIPADVRVIAATNRDLEEDVAQGRFREDLLYRLDVVRLVIPPLRRRRGDIPQLVGRLLRQLGHTSGRTDVVGIQETALQKLVEHDWPGNVRELLNVLERSLLLAEGPRLRLADLPDSLGGRIQGGPKTAGSTLEPDEDWVDRSLPEVRDEVVDRVERSYLALLLRRTGGRLGETARRAGISPRALYDKMRRLGLRKEDYRA